MWGPPIAGGRPPVDDLSQSVLLIIPVGTAWADDILIAFDFATFVASPGDTLTFTGTIQNLDSAIVDLNGCQVNMTGQLATDCSPFFTFAPLTVGPLDTTPDFAMFTVMVNVPYTDPYGAQAGTFDVLGGVEGAGGYDPTTQNLLGDAVFSMDVVPEPGTAALLGLAGIAMAATMRRRGNAR
jgi:PEP-CTERM motif